jgi:GT2 family glycosyltransferase
MRVGHNPARFVDKVDQPAAITVAVVNCIPFRSGSYEQSLEVLKVVVECLHATREEPHPYDVMIFDNHSCAEVRAYLKGAHDQGKIQYLVLSDKNVGKIGAWNFMFGAAQGEYVVFSDGDIGFRPGWLNASLDLFETFPNVGMVTARPLKTPKAYSTATFEWAQREGVLEEGRFLSREIYWEHARSIERLKDEGDPSQPVRMSRVTYSGKIAYAGAAHFQFMCRRKTLQQIIPLQSNYPMRGERALDIAINQMGLLRLMTEQALVWHMGNRLTADAQITETPPKKSLLKKFLYLPGVRRLLLWLNNRIFRLYFLNVE